MSMFDDKKGKEILQIVSLVANEKNIEKQVIYSALENALSAVVAKSIDEDADVRVNLDVHTGCFDAARFWEIVADDAVEMPSRQISLTDAKAEAEDAEVGGFVSEEVPVDALSRIGASQAKQIIVRLVRDAERQKQLAHLEKRIGELVSAQVKKVTKESIIFELFDGTEALMPKDAVIPKEILHVGDRVRAYFKDTNKEGRGPLVLLSRGCVDYMLKVFCIEVPEVDEGQIEIKAAARDAGYRAKIAVKSKDNRVDPIGACVGMRGSRVQAISNDLNGERIDIIMWDDNPAQLVVNALAPAEVQSVVVDEVKRSMDIAVDEEQLSQAIGRNGQNIRLASELTGWSLNVMTQDDMLNKGRSESKLERNILVEKLDIDDDIASVLIREGLLTVEKIAHVDATVLESVEEFDADIAEALIARAKDALLSDILFSDKVEIPEELNALTNLSETVANALVSAGIDTQAKIADCAVDDLQDVVDISVEEAGKIIMEAREAWFNENDATDE